MITDGVDKTIDDNEIKIQFGKNLLELRQQRGLTRKQLGEALKISAVTVQSYEKGLRQPNFQMLFKIAIYFDVSLDNLLGYSDVARNIDIDKYRLDRVVNLLIPLGDVWTDSKQPNFFVLFVRNENDLFQIDGKGTIIATKGKIALVFNRAADLIDFAEYVQREAIWSDKDLKTVFVEKGEKLFTDAESAKKMFRGNAYPLRSMYITRAGDIYFPVMPSPVLI